MASTELQLLSGTATGATTAVGALVEAGVKHLFAVHGANCEDIFAAAQGRHSDLRTVVAKHEFSAVAMADGYFRASCRLAAAMTTSGGGSLNALAALGEAAASGVPLLALLGEPPSNLAGKGAFQDQSGSAGSMDLAHAVQAVGAWCERVNSPLRLAGSIRRAVAAALRERRPAAILVPKDVQQGSIALVPAVADDVSRATPSPDRDPGMLDVSQPHPELPSGARCALEEAQRIVIIAGLDVVLTDSREALQTLAELLGAAVAVEPDAMDAYDNHAPNFVGVLGAMGHPSAREAIARADLCLAVGARLGQMATTGIADLLAARTLLHVGSRPPWLTAQHHVPAPSSALTPAIHQVTACLSRRRMRVAATDGPHLSHLPVPRPSRGQLSYRDFAEAISASVGAGTTVVADAGNTGSAAVHYIRTPAENGRFILALGMGGMGFSFGAGIGAMLATGKRSYVIAGDGSFLMHGLEIHTAIEYRMPITFIIVNNDGNAACSGRERLILHQANIFRHSTLAGGIGAMFSAIDARRASSVSTLRSMIEETDGDGGTHLIEVCIPNDAHPPYLPLLPAEIIEQHPTAPAVPGNDLEGYRDRD
ncbi:thiamine pyrophosphate-binding protein [Pseudonocardia sp. SCN 73-27]|uniref:thiamine pyrophosphate-binding protein n=1 Tax=Pseudonocardia sp. SCN 73-27 TaxID=1660132 RepID=UPI0025F475AB|nr:thiamine pyrophosphate-binding protein [Pseudonocardia sp. SCN 73-27]